VVIPAVIEVTAGARGSELLLRRPGEVVVLDTGTGNVRQRVTLGPTSMAPIHAGPGSMLCIDGTLHHADGRVAAQLPEGVQFLGRRTVARAGDGRWGIGGCWGAHLDAGCFVTTDRNGASVRKATTRPVSFATFSPDGSRLFLVHPVGGSSLEGRLCILDAATFAVQKELDTPVAQWHFLDDQRALVVSGGKLQVWDVAKLSPVQTLLDDVGDVQLSDDRRTLLLQGQREVLVYRVLCD
jgi:WD40 repeat protein